MKTNIIKVVGLSTLLQLALAGTGTLQAKIYKCVSEDGNVNYIATPCPVNHEEEELAHSKDPTNSMIRAYKQHTLANSQLERAPVGKSVTAGAKEDNTKKLNTSTVSKHGGGNTEISASTSSGTVQNSSTGSNSTTGSTGSSLSSYVTRPATELSALKTY